MSYTIVTSFLLQNRDINNIQKINDYISRFEYIKNLNIPTILFLDKRLVITETTNLKIIYVDIEDTWIYSLYKKNHPALPLSRNTQKDTAEYMFIQNSKSEWVYKSSILNPFNTTYFVWIDFGISHVIKNKDNFKILKNLKLTKDILISAINSKSHDELTKRICWRFAGGIFIIKKTHTELFFNTCKSVIEKMFPNLTWEVNVWCEVEKLLPVSVYYADHNDSILLNINPL